MKKNVTEKLILIISVFFIHQFIYGQSIDTKFGKISMDEMKMKLYEKDSSANALILSDVGFTSFKYSDDKGFTVQTERTVRLKIFNKNALDKGNLTIKLYEPEKGSDKEELISIKGVTYNLVDGKIKKTKLSKDGIFKERLNDYYVSTKIAMPTVQEGSIIEIKYMVESDFLFSLREWQFQYDIPVLQSHYTVQTPEVFIYKQLFKGYIGLKTDEKSYNQKFTYTYGSEMNTSGERTKAGIGEFELEINETTYHANNVPALYEEPYMDNVNNYLSSLEFELESYRPKWGRHQNFSRTWEDIRRELMENSRFGGVLSKGGFLNDIANTIQTKSSSDEEKMVQSFLYIQKKMKWDGYYDFFVKNNLKKTFEEEFGNSADINFMLIILLRKAGLNANPVVLSTRKNGILMPGQISITKFNYVIACVDIDGNNYLLDATNKNCPYYLLPPRCINGQGRLISETSSSWIDIKSSQAAKKTCMINLTLNETNSFEGEIITKYENYHALDKRNNLSNEIDQKEYYEKFEGKNPGLKIVEYSFEDMDTIEKPLTEKLKISYETGIEEAGNYIYINPMLFNKQATNPFKLEERVYPVDYTFPHDEKYIISITIPESYQVEEMPKAASIKLPDNKGKFSYIAQNREQTIQVITSLNINKAVFSGVEYPELKQLYEEIVRKHNEIIVLKKI